MRNKEQREWKMKFVLIVVVIALAIASVVIAQSNPLEEELARLVQELNDAGYSCLTKGGFI